MICLYLNCDGVVKHEFFVIPSFPRRRESRYFNTFWIEACAYLLPTGE